MSALEEQAETATAVLERIAKALERIATVLEDNSNREYGRFNVGGVIVTREDRP